MGVHCTLYTVPPPPWPTLGMYTVHCTLYTVHCTHPLGAPLGMCTVHCTLYTVLHPWGLPWDCALYTVHCTLSTPGTAPLGLAHARICVLMHGGTSFLALCR